MGMDFFIFTPQMEGDMRKILGVVSAIFLISSCQTNERTNEAEALIYPDETLFELVDSLTTGVTFSNELVEGLNTNVLVYEYFYNGGGVATADFNGDELIDIYFVSNMGTNQLYLNKGDWQFEEVASEAAVTGRAGPWKTGVSYVDINSDGLMDIYLCYSGALPPDKRKNEMFVNQGNNEAGVPSFVEQAEEYGLASTAFSNQGFFFDHDLDGDLDMLLLNHNPKSIPVLTPSNTQRMLAQDDPERGLRLFENRENRFVDITTAAGINGSALSYGLGLGIADVNQDNYPDFYVSNDYEIPDYLYINNGDGTFTDELRDRVEHVSKFSMGNNLSDINNDGHVDIFTLDMLPEDNKRQKLLLAPDNYNEFDQILEKGFHHQYMRNMLQVANGDGTYSEIGQLSGVSNTDWSWAALFADYDNDGWKDLYVTNGYQRDYTNLDFIDYMDNYVQSAGRLQREDVMNLLAEMPSSNVTNYVFQNQQGQGFTNENINWGVHESSNSNGAAYADLDNDGDLDMVVNNINKGAFLYQNTSIERGDGNYLMIRLTGDQSNPMGIGATVTLTAGDQKQQQSQHPYRGYLSAVSPVLHFGLGDKETINSLVVTWPDGRSQSLVDVPVNQTLTLKVTDASMASTAEKGAVAVFRESQPVVDFTDPASGVRDYNRQPLLINQLSYTGPCMTTGDVNGDGLDDLLIGGAKGESAKLYLGSTEGLQLVNVRSFVVDQDSHDTDAVFLDANGDGLMDIYVASGGYHDYEPDDPRLQDRLYINDGLGDFYKNIRALPEWRVSTGAVAVLDFDDDGDQDLFVGGRVIPGRFPEVPGGAVLINDGRGRFSSIFDDFTNIGHVNDAQWTDLEGDGQPDLILAGEWMPLSVWTWTGEQFTDRTAEVLGGAFNGWWNSVEVYDLNGDGVKDIVAGNNGLNCQIQVSAEEPAELYYADFDENGAVDPILCYYVEGKSYPYPGRKELLKQLVSLQSKFTSYESYAEATLEDVLDRRQRQAASKLMADHFETSLFLSTGEGTYTKGKLPIQAQYAPVHQVVIRDFDSDGVEDLLLAGNNSYSSLRLGRFDANYGQLFKGLGLGQFAYIPQSLSGLQLKGDVRAVVPWGDKQLIFGMTGSSLKAYEW